MVALGIGLIHHGLQSPTPPPQPTAAQRFPAHANPPPPVPIPRTAPISPAIPVSPTVMAQPMPTPAPAPAKPTRVRIPSIRVNAPLTGLSLTSDGKLASPPETDRNLAGWYQDGTRPGSVGTAIIGGHVDTHSGRAVFYNLGALRKGSLIDIDRADGTVVRFTIDAVEAYTDKQFPNDKVYGAAQRPELRLITCGGGFDKRRQRYLGNVVAFAHLTDTRRALP
ncbi:class F sortase [Streptomyces sp. H39-S7]|uniref:class F sortase n=1 Tax=Streptomyces sp. H39-S7 TaxID=3004357 RepID=UPI0022AFEDDB|nr:class F sortase [Streptomyces sp. H39-S7]MCZ4119838.1 class F sortase [Streptomyces sp. H39-S7]